MGVVVVASVGKLGGVAQYHGGNLLWLLALATVDLRVQWQPSLLW